MLLMGIDYETTGLDMTTLEVTEVGAVLWDSDRKAPVQVFNEFVKGPIVPANITELTGITQSDLDQFGIPYDSVQRKLIDMYGRAEACVAHNKLFDETIWKRDMPVSVHSKVWIDTSVDVPYPSSITTRKLTHLAAEHGFLNPFAHRALSDVFTMMKVLSNYNVQEVYSLAQQPNVLVCARTNYEEREKAKARGYRWEGQSKRWLKNLKISQIEKEQAEAGFQIEVV